MKQILLIMVGGTICTERSDKGTLKISEKADETLLDALWSFDPAYKNKVHFEVTPNLGILSENMTVDTWNRILEEYRKNRHKCAYDGVIFAHGTDTLAYSAALFSQILMDAELPVFFVSSNAKLASPRANGAENFRYAVECILHGITPNVYATYKNISDETMYLHLASRLTQCPAYSEDFKSEGMMKMPKPESEDFAAFLEEVNRLYPRKNNVPTLDSMGNWHLENTVLKLQPYVGLDYSVFCYDKYRAILHGTYHSGTASAARDKTDAFSVYSVLYMLYAAKNADVYLSPARKEGEVYDSVREIYENGARIQFLYGLTEEAAYAKLLLAYSVFQTADERKMFINTDRNYETVYSAK